MRDRILNDLTMAMKNKDKEVLSVIRMVKGAMQLEEINKKRPLDDEEVTGIIIKQIKTRKESIVEFEKGNRSDLVDQTNKEITILNNYMPEQMSEEDVVKVINEAFTKLDPKGVSDIGKMMGYITPIVKGKTDMGFVNRLIKEKLSNL